MSANTTITSSDIYIGDVLVGALASGADVQFDKTIPVNTTIPPGTYYVGYIMDYNNQIVESNEGNNSAYVPNRRLVVLNSPPNTPSCLSPANGATGQSLTPTLNGSSFGDLNGDSHASSQWLLSRDTAGMVHPIYDTGESTTAKTSLTIPGGVLANDGHYYWTMRYKDSRGSWSGWASGYWFRTVASGPPPPQVFDSSQPITGTSASRWAFMSAWNLSTGALTLSPTWYNGNSTWNHDAAGAQQWIARFVYDQSSGQTRALAWYYRQAHVQ